MQNIKKFFGKFLNTTIRKFEHLIFEVKEKIFDFFFIRVVEKDGGKKVIRHFNIANLVRLAVNVAFFYYVFKHNHWL